jgi:hypothetical protein
VTEAVVGVARMASVGAKELSAEILRASSFKSITSQVLK